MRHIVFQRLLLTCALTISFASFVYAQEAPATGTSVSSSGNATPPSPTVTVGRTPETSSSETEEVRRALDAQRREIDELRRMLNEQSRIINDLRSRVEQTEGARTVNGTPVETATGSGSAQVSQTPVATTTQPAQAAGGGQTPPIEERVSRVETQTRTLGENIARQLGSITFSGDIRLQYDSIFGQLNAQPNANNPSIVGNELSARNRFRLRARLAMRGRIGNEFDWGLRLATGSFPNPVSTNQILTDFYTRKPFALDQLYIAWTPRQVPGLRLQGGKFDPPWTRTEMTIDNDLQVEGFSQAYTREFPNSTLRNFSLIAWQLPFLERNSAFVRNADGTVSIDASRRAGRDLALYGAQARARFQINPRVALTLSVADLNFSGTQFISPVQFFGGQLQLPVTVTIPATATSPAQTLTGQATIPRELLVAGNGNLGLSAATNNAVGRDGRLASGFNLIDTIARLDITTSSPRFPVMIILDFVTNTLTRDVIVAGPGGADVILPNDENNGLWAEFRIGRTENRGEFSLGYTFARIEKDAVLTPFNFDDFVQQSDVRSQRFTFFYAVDPRVVLGVTGIFSQRPNGLLGAFGQTPAGSLNRPTVRLQFDTTFRF
jgi:hypothetical protein